MRFILTPSDDANFYQWTNALFQSSNLHRLSRHCARCRKMRSGGSEVKLFYCTGCRVSCYCSKECQRMSWPAHRAFCINRSVDSSEPCPLSAFTIRRHPFIAPIVGKMLNVERNREAARQYFVLTDFRLEGQGTRHAWWKLELMQRRVMEVMPESVKDEVDRMMANPRLRRDDADLLFIAVRDLGKMQITMQWMYLKRDY